MCAVASTALLTKDPEVKSRRDRYQGPTMSANLEGSFGQMLYGWHMEAVERLIPIHYWEELLILNRPHYTRAKIFYV